MFITQQNFDNAKTNRDKFPWNKYYPAVISLADSVLKLPPPRIDTNRHNWILEQAKCFGRYGITLAGAYRLTGESIYAEKCITLIEDALQWEMWYWDHESSGGYGYDLTTGELGYSLSMLMHLLGGSLKQTQRAKIYDAVRERILNRYISSSGTENHRGKPAHWYTWHTNWNAICNGGMLSLAFYMADKEPGYSDIIPTALKGLDYYLDALHEDGSSIEGIGYWNYGVSYMAYALFSYESYYGKSHPVFERNVFRGGLSFPFDFSPKGAGISFGDVNYYTPSPIMYQLAEKAGRMDISNETTQRLIKEMTIPVLTGVESCNFGERELYALLFCSEETPSAPDEEREHCKVYPDNGWMVFASCGLRLSLRSGSTDVPHAVKDLNSVQLAKNGERLLENIVNSPYTLGWFTPGRELYAENQTTSKNAVLINGTGQLFYASAKWNRELDSISSNAKKAYPEYVTDAERTVSADSTGITIKDVIETDAGAWHEVRYITKGDFTKIEENEYRLSCGTESCVMAFSGSCDLKFYISELANSIAERKSAKMLRVVSQDTVKRSVICTVIK